MMLWYMFENHVISSSSKPFSRLPLRTAEFENHAILPFFKAGITMKKFENHVILSSAKPNTEV